MPSPADQQFHASLPLAWSPDHDQVALSEQLQRVENQVRALRLEQVAHWMTENWPSDLGYVNFSLHEQQWFPIPSVPDHLWRLPEPPGETDDQKKARKEKEIRRHADHQKTFEPLLGELVHRLEKVGLSDQKMRVLLQGAESIGPTFVGLEDLQDNAQKVVEELVGPLRRALSLDQSLPESPRSRSSSPRF